MSKLFLSLLICSSALFGASASSFSAGEIEERQVGPFRVSAFDTNSYYSQANSWPAFGSTEAGSIAVLLKKAENPNVSMMLRSFAVPFVTKMPLSLVQSTGVGSGGIPDHLKGAAAQQIIDFSTNVVYGHTAATQIAVLLNWGGTWFKGTGQMKPEQCSGVPYLDKVEELGADVVEHVLRLPDSKDGDDSPVVTWKKPTE